jgi:hypothetical protein
MIGSLRSNVATRLARRAAKRNAHSPYIGLSALQGHSGGGGLKVLKQLLQEALDEAARADNRYLEVYGRMLFVISCRWFSSHSLVSFPYDVFSFCLPSWLTFSIVK